MTLTSCDVRCDFSQCHHLSCFRMVGIDGQIVVYLYEQSPMSQVGGARRGTKMIIFIAQRTQAPVVDSFVWPCAIGV